MCARSSERPQGRAAPGPPPAGVKQSGKAAFACESPQGRAASSPPPAGGGQRGRATSCEPGRRRARGFTLMELIAVMVLVAVLAAVALPKLDAGLALRNDAWHDEVLGALRLARQTAVSHRRLVCATVGSSVSLSIAAANPASACDSPLAGPDGSSPYATAPGGASASVSPAGTLYFQPSGRVTSDGAGMSASDRSIAIGGSDTISVVGETGHVQ